LLGKHGWKTGNSSPLATVAARANASHFATDLGKGASDKMSRAFRVLSLNDNVSWVTALGNDYSFDDVFVRQLANYGRPGDLVLVMSVSGNSPNLVKAVEWANAKGLKTIALTVASVVG
jgi:D-sedoheptulose 7-phosphate isomerase